MSNYWKEIDAISKEPGALPLIKVLVPTNEALIRKTKNGAAWTWALAALSVANLALAYFEAPIRLTFGLAITDVLFGFGQAYGPLASYVALALSAPLLGVFVYLGVQAENFKVWAFVSLLVFMAADTGFLIWYAWLTGSSGIATMLFHLLAFAFLWDGWKAAKLYATRRQRGDA